MFFRDDPASCSSSDLRATEKNSIKLCRYGWNSSAFIPEQICPAGCSDALTGTVLLSSGKRPWWRAGPCLHRYQAKTHYLSQRCYCQHLPRNQTLILRYLTGLLQIKNREIKQLLWHLKQPFAAFLLKACFFSPAPVFFSNSPAETGEAPRIFCFKLKRCQSSL